MALIEQGESAVLEFKSTLRYDMKLAKKNPELAKVVAKSVAGLMNSRGGTLLIGVSDSKEILGLGDDFSILSRPNKDGFEQAFRSILCSHLGTPVSSRVDLTFIERGDKIVACATCPRSSSPIFFADGERNEFYIRDGNTTKPLRMQEAYSYIRHYFESTNIGPAEDLRRIIREELEASRPRAKERSTAFRLLSRRVIEAFLDQALVAHGWRRLYIVSPWISDFECFEKLLRRLKEDKATAYVVTRPPQDDWHVEAIASLEDTGRANISLVPDLHMKLYTVAADSGGMALLGSANMTKQSLENHEIGILVHSYAGGKHFVDRLESEAQQIYRHPARKVIAHAKL